MSFSVPPTYMCLYYRCWMVLDPQFICFVLHLCRCHSRISRHLRRRREIPLGTVPEGARRGRQTRRRTWPRSGKRPRPRSRWTQARLPSPLINVTSERFSLIPLLRVLLRMERVFFLNSVVVRSFEEVNGRLVLNVCCVAVVLQYLSTYSELLERVSFFHRDLT